MLEAKVGALHSRLRRKFDSPILNRKTKQKINHRTFVNFFRRNNERKMTARLVTYLTTILVILPPENVLSNYDNSMVNRLLQDRDILIQDGLSYFNGTTLEDVKRHDDGHEVRCIMSIENWSKWMLSFPVVYTQYGDFQYGFHEREVFPAHKEIVVAVNELDSITGSSGTIAWELGHKNIHFIVMWSIPYNMHFYDAHFGLGMVHLSTKFTRDMLPYWYKRMYEGGPGTYKRSPAGKSIFYKHHDVFVIGHLTANTYHPMLNISVIPWKHEEPGTVDTPQDVHADRSREGCATYLGWLRPSQAELAFASADALNSSMVLFSSQHQTLV